MEREPGPVDECCSTCKYSRKPTLDELTTKVAPEQRMGLEHFCEKKDNAVSAEWYCGEYEPKS